MACRQAFTKFPYLLRKMLFTSSAASSFGVASKKGSGFHLARKLKFSSTRYLSPSLSRPWKINFARSWKPKVFSESTNSSYLMVLVPSVSSARKAASALPKRSKMKCRKRAKTSAPTGSSSSIVAEPLSSLSKADQSCLGSPGHPRWWHAFRNCGFCISMESSGLSPQRQARTYPPYLCLRKYLKSSRAAAACFRSLSRFARSLIVRSRAFTLMRHRRFSISNHLRFHAEM
mmetsp:Transcript_100481/g.284685  ORF Transcript_100481/g.284685 Transcript_100481/m.284685 type:complete len:231 (-) Transcript_100481:979-1671(-)